tara:strand:- start:3669 stop:4154 length:486 start_codon:yes stop_codon:yes gene_type:complete
MSETLDILDSIAQVLANTYDGALDENGEPIKIGLRREEGNPMIDHRIIDGFGACVLGDRLHIKYHAEIPLKEVHSNSFESDMESMVEKVKSYIQKEFKKIKKQALTLSDPSEVDVLVEYISRIRTSVKVHKCFKIGGIPAEPEREIDPEFERMNKLGGLRS